ncbi:hypothetical protein JHK82_018894 [Glycine max]|nr:hypothetical protein JHK85_019334 [Glycine max]KAG5143199.1 hypothetical protein JHK82_018894 [Glycine max]
MISEVDSDDGGHINLTEFIELKTKLRCLPWWRWILFRVQLNKLVDVNGNGCNEEERSTFPFRENYNLAYPSRGDDLAIEAKPCLRSALFSRALASPWLSSYDVKNLEKVCSVLVGVANGKCLRVKAAVRSHVKSGHHFQEVPIW